MRINYSQAVLLVFSFSLISCSSEIVNYDDELLRLSYTSKYESEEKNAFVYIPRNYKKEKNKEWPVILFLHGNGERGNGKDELDYVLIHGPLYEAWIQKKNLPFIIISPQLPIFGKDQEYEYLKNRDVNSIPKRLLVGTPKRNTDFALDYPMRVSHEEAPLNYELPDRGWEERIEDVILILDKVIQKYDVDTNRIYLTGLSYGGYGVWYIASQYPNIFAAIAPVVGWGHPEFMEPIAKHQIPVWAFAGGRDLSVKKDYFFEGLNKLEELGHYDIRFTIHEDMGHDTWKRVYSGKDLYDWLLDHEKK
jgi:predicted peptidase